MWGLAGAAARNTKPMCDLQPKRPTSVQKLLFWGILGALSVCFAEVTVGSSPFAFFDAWGLLVVCPLYLLHLLVLARVAFARGPPRFPALFFAGVLFGLYEAYMTKQLWNPDWSSDPVRAGGVAVFETIILVLWWHPVMAFLVPLLVAETALCRSRHVARTLPRRLQRILFGKRGTAVLLVLAVLLGLVLSSDHTLRPSAGDVFVSGLASVGVLFLLVWLWRRATRGVRMALPELLPTGREMVMLCVCLALQYVGLGMLVRPEALPALGPQASVWLLYVAAITGLWLGLRRPRPASLFGHAESPDRFSWRLWFGLATVLVVTATGSRLLLGSATWLFLIANLIVGVPVGVVILVLCFRDVLRPLRTGPPGGVAFKAP